MYSFVAFLLLVSKSLAQTGFDAYSGWAQSELTTYSTVTTPCNVTQFVSSLPSGFGYYSDTGVVGGWCKSILPFYVDSVRSEFVANAWTSHPSGVTYLPHEVISAYTKMICKQVQFNTYALADGTPSQWTYSSLDECFDKCNNDPLCVGFLDRSPGISVGNVCAWKSDESNLDVDSTCENDYYRKGTYPPSLKPTVATTTQEPTWSLTVAPTTQEPTLIPTVAPTTEEPTLNPTVAPTLPIAQAPLTLCENKDNSPNITDTFDEVVCLCTEYENEGWSWSRNQLTDDLERKIRMLANAGGELTDGSPMFLTKWKARMNYHVYLHDSADDDTVNNVLYHRRVWRKVCLSTTRRRSMMREFALKIDAMNM